MVYDHITSLFMIADVISLVFFVTCYDAQANIDYVVFFFVE